MKISPVSFGKNYIRQIKAENNHTKKPETLHFVEYEDKASDKERLKVETATKFDAMEGVYAKWIYRDYIQKPKDDDSVKFWGIEDKNGNVQALVETRENVETGYGNIMPNKKGMEVTLMCVNSTNSHNSKDRKYKKMGFHLVTNIIKEAMENKSEFIILENAEDDFWNKIPYLKDYEYGLIKILDSEDFQKCSSKLDKKV